MLKIKIFTSYFAKAKQLSAINLVPVGICYKPPHWFFGKNVSDLAPTWDILKIGKAGDTRGYTKLFKEKLAKTDFHSVINQLQEISDANDGKDIALCCFETTKDFCHRHLVADWFRENGVEVIEAFVTPEGYSALCECQKKFQ